MAVLPTMRNNISSMTNTIAPVAGSMQERDRYRRANQPWRKWYNSKRWKDLRLLVLQRDGWTCQKTNELLIHKPHLLVAHHKVPHNGNHLLFWDENNIECVSKQYHDSELQSKEKIFKSNGIG